MIKKKTIKIRPPKHITPYNAQHVGRRDEQQDYFAYSDIFNPEESDLIGAVSVLADGMGGLENGRLASHTATDVFLAEYKEAILSGADINSGLVRAAYAANAAVREIDGAGTTLCAAVIKDWNLYWLSVGDSRIYLYRNGSVRRINTEHNYEKVLDRMAANGEITVEEAMLDPNRAALTSYIGMDDLEEIDLTPGLFPLFSGDSIMLCSDGLYKSLSEAEISSIVRDADDDVCDVLIDAAMRKNIVTQDNITVVLMDVD